jgi:hypothetical protein
MIRCAARSQGECSSNHALAVVICGRMPHEPPTSTDTDHEARVTRRRWSPVRGPPTTHDPPAGMRRSHQISTRSHGTGPEPDRSILVRGKARIRIIWRRVRLASSPGDGHQRSDCPQPQLMTWQVTPCRRGGLTHPPRDTSCAMLHKTAGKPLWWTCGACYKTHVSSAIQAAASCDSPVSPTGVRQRPRTVRCPGSHSRHPTTPPAVTARPQCRDS